MDIVGFQTEIISFPPIDGVGHQSLSLGKTLSVLSLSLLFESPRCQDLLVWSSFSFQEVFYHSPRVPLFLYPQRGSGTFVFHHYVKCILSFFMFCGMFVPTNTFILKSWLTCILVIWQVMGPVRNLFSNSRCLSPCEMLTILPSSMAGIFPYGSLVVGCYSNNTTWWR